MTSPFNEDYFIRGKASGVSNYENYRWLPHLTIPACRKIAAHLGAHPHDSFIDVGCSRGYYVRGLRECGMKAFGYDVSEWAVSNCDPEVIEWVSTTMPRRAFDWALLKDVAEHIEKLHLVHLVDWLHRSITKGMLFIVPLAERTGGRYVRQEDELDVTHINRWTLEDWLRFLEDHAPEFNVSASYHIHGIKPASQQVHHSCGFLTLLRP